MQLRAEPRGSLSNLLPVPLDADASVRALGPGDVLLSVSAVGLNFRDVLNVLDM